MKEKMGGSTIRLLLDLYINVTLKPLIILNDLSCQI